MYDTETKRCQLFQPFPKPSWANDNVYMRKFTLKKKSQYNTWDDLHTADLSANLSPYTSQTWAIMDIKPLTEEEGCGKIFFPQNKAHSPRMGGPCYRKEKNWNQKS